MFGATYMKSYSIIIFLEGTGSRICGLFIPGFCFVRSTTRSGPGILQNLMRYQIPYSKFSSLYSCGVIKLYIRPDKLQAGYSYAKQHSIFNLTYCAGRSSGWYLREWWSSVVEVHPHCINRRWYHYLTGQVLVLQLQCKLVLSFVKVHCQLLCQLLWVRPFLPGTCLGSSEPRVA